jgi:23S rRNA pseudouridine1911/1915/1917 synthase
MTKKIIKLQVEAEHAGKRLDLLLPALLPDYSRSHLQKLIKSGAVRCGGAVCAAQRSPVKSGDSITVEIEEAESRVPTGENIDLPTLYEDDSLLVINKPPGMVVHPGAGNHTGTVVNALLGRNPELAEELAADESRPGIVHRLDKDTSGCLAIAKTPQAQFKLSRSFAEREVIKTYAALVRGIPAGKTGKIVTLIGRHPVNRQKMAVTERNGREAVTIYEALKSGRIEGIQVSMLSVRILTGRTHQIRVHMAHKGHPVLGDALYGGSQKLKVSRQMLHAWKLSFPHPETGKMISFEAPLPDDFTAIMDLIRS